MYVNVEQLKVGDRVLVGRSDYELRVVLVERKTKTQVVLDNGDRIGAHGRLMGEGGAWSCRFVAPYDEERLAEFHRRARRARASNWAAKVDWTSLSLETLDAVRALVAPELRRPKPEGN